MAPLLLQCLIGLGFPYLEAMPLPLPFSMGGLSQTEQGQDSQARELEPPSSTADLSMV